MFSAENSSPSSSRFVTVWTAVLLFTGGVLFPLGSLLYLTWSRGAINWIDRQYQCKSRCLEARPASAGPRIIIFGGSASVFGLDAELMEQKLGIQTINFATHAGLGLDFQLSRIKRFAKKGDTALLVLELEAYGDNAVPGEYLREYAFSFEKSYVFSLKPRVMLSFLFLNRADDYVETFTRWNERLSGLSEQNISLPREEYSLIKLSANGDFRGKPPYQPFDVWPPEGAVSSYAKNSLKAASEWCRQHGVHLIITWPNRVYFPPPEGQKEFKTTRTSQTSAKLSGLLLSALRKRASILGRCSSTRSIISMKSGSAFGQTNSSAACARISDSRRPLGRRRCV